MTDTQYLKIREHLEEYNTEIEEVLTEVRRVHQDIKNNLEFLQDIWISNIDIFDGEFDKQLYCFKELEMLLNTLYRLHYRLEGFTVGCSLAANQPLKFEWFPALEYLVPDIPNIKNINNINNINNSSENLKSAIYNQYNLVYDKIIISKVYLA